MLADSAAILRGAALIDSAAQSVAHQIRLAVGDGGKIYCGFEGQNPRLIPESKMKAFQPPPDTLTKSVGHYLEWIAAIKGGEPSLCNFDYAGPLAETVLLGNVAYRTGKKLDWDSASLKARGCPEADRFIRKEYRKGWTL